MVKVVTVKFKNEIHFDEIPLFRGAINQTQGCSDILFHNHLENGKLKYGYPLVQYKQIDGKAAMVFIGDDASGNINRFSLGPIKTHFGNRPITLEVDTIEETEINVERQCESHYYHLSHWLALDQENYLFYHNDDTAIERIERLQKIIIGNIKSFCKSEAVDYWIPETESLVCDIVELHESYYSKFKDFDLLSFNCVFRSNMVLPDNIGLGGKVSFGYGTVTAASEKEVFRKRPEKLFLLGGKDLEIKTIKELIKRQRNCDFIDRNLRWENACLSKYKDVLDSFKKTDIYAVELMEDIEIDDEWKDRYHRIDHHNEYCQLPSSLEQVASVLGVELNRKQRLIAANDVGYIPAMKALMATDEEIAEIRREDRRAQGVTEKDERLAEQSIVENLMKTDKLIVVKSLTSRFSPICDQLFPYKRLLIYTDSEWVFYGEGKSELVQCNSGAIQEGKLYHGGGENGFIGSVKGKFSQDEIEQIVESIKNKYERI